MPELPEVETVRRGIDSSVLGMRVTSVDVRRRDVVFTAQEGPSEGRPPALLAGQVVDRTERRGKYLAVMSARGEAFLVHLGMTGTLTVVEAPPMTDRHTHVVWRLGRGSCARWLVFRDPRRFGYIEAVESPAELERALSHLGPDALTIEPAALAAALRRRRTSIKAALLNQRLLAGIGNIYADEALFRAGIHPARIAAELTAHDVGRLASAIRRVLRSALEHGGSSIRDYRDSSGRAGEFQRRHQVYGRAGMPCRVCSRPLRAIRLAQRTTTLCEFCQPRRVDRHSD